MTDTDTDSELGTSPRAVRAPLASARRGAASTGPLEGPARRAWLEAELTRPEAYPHPVERVECLRTLVSLLFFAGERVYKLKQAVDLGYIDTRAPQERRRLCHEELRLNAELAPGVHLGVRRITLERDGHLKIDGTGETVEVAVEMRRLPAELMLESRLERCEVEVAEMDSLAALLAAFHARAASGPGVNEFGSPEGVADCVEENFDQIAPFVSELAPGFGSSLSVLSPAQHTFLHERATAFLDDGHRLMLRRVAQGRIREGHGDLHAGNVCCLPERVVIFDRIEFNRRFRCLDVASDIAFLSMDLDQRGFPELAALVEQRYAVHARDPELRQLLPFYKGYRAIVRAKVAALLAAGAAPRSESRESSRVQAMRYVQLAAGYELPPFLLLLCGLPGTGKSFLAPWLARPLRATLLRSDERRKRLAGLAPGQSARAEWGSGLYTPQSRQQTYDALLADARSSLQSGRSVVVDATFSQRALRAPFLEAAAALSVPSLIVEVTAPEDVVRERLAARAGHDASDADFAIYERAAEVYEPPGSHCDEAALSVDSTWRTAVDQAGQVIDRLIAMQSA